MIERLRGWLFGHHRTGAERDEVEAQRFWREWYSEHPEELRRSAAPLDGPRSAASAVIEAGAASPRRKPDRAMLTVVLILNLILAVVQGILTVVLAVLGASADFIWLGVMWTFVWSVQATVLWVRIERTGGS